MREVTVATSQMTCSWELDANIAQAEALVREAHAQGAQIIQLQELFETPYFCIDQHPDHFALAQPYEGNSLIAHFAALARELSVVLPISFFERAGNTHFNSVTVIDADGSHAGIYRKTHIPNGPGYQEKQFFTPGDSGFKVWDTRYARIGVGICWDQWFPESARSMSLLGAELLFYPTAIGSEPQDPTINSQPHWTRVQQGNAGANLLPLIAANRIGTEQSKYVDGLELTFYGSSFIADQEGAIVAQADRETTGVWLHTFDLDAIEQQRLAWGLFRDRRPACYHAL